MVTSPSQGSPRRQIRENHAFIIRNKQPRQLAIDNINSLMTNFNYSPTTIKCVNIKNIQSSLRFKETSKIYQT